jgi:hypothetical protein
MNKKITTIILLALMAGLAYVSLFSLAKKPVSFFVLMAAGTGADAYKLDMALAPLSPTLARVTLSASQMREGAGILEQKSTLKLREFARQFGKWPAVIGIPSKDPLWPVYLGGGWRAVLSGCSTGEFDDLNFADKLYLALRTKAPAPISPAVDMPIEVGAPLTTEEASSKLATPVSASAAPAGPLRVEILNGCGIKRAADWVALRLKGPGIVITGTGNADNYRHSDTIIRTYRGVTPALEEVMKRMGIPLESAAMDDSLGTAIDVRIVIGKDFPKIKEQLRGRQHHRTK